MVKVIDSEVVIKAYFKKYREKNHLKYAELKRIRYTAEPHVNAYIDVTYTSLRRVQIVHHDKIRMDNVQITIVGDSLRHVNASEKPLADLLDRYL